MKVKHMRSKFSVFAIKREGLAVAEDEKTK